MKKKQLKLITNISYSENILNLDVVEKIVNLLKRKDLKQYIRALKMREKESSIVIDTPLPLTDEERLFLEKIFVGKRIENRINPELLLGIRVTNNDNIYDVSLKSKLENIISYLS